MSGQQDESEPAGRWNQPDPRDGIDSTLDLSRLIAQVQERIRPGDGEDVGSNGVSNGVSIGGPASAARPKPEPGPPADGGAVVGHGSAADRGETAGPARDPAPEPRPAPGTERRE